MSAPDEADALRETEVVVDILTDVLEMLDTLIAAATSRGLDPEAVAKLAHTAAGLREMQDRLRLSQAVVMDAMVGARSRADADADLEALVQGLPTLMARYLDGPA